MADASEQLSLTLAALEHVVTLLNARQTSAAKAALEKQIAAINEFFLAAQSSSDAGADASSYYDGGYYDGAAVAAVGNGDEAAYADEAYAEQADESYAYEGEGEGEAEAEAEADESYAYAEGEGEGEGEESYAYAEDEGEAEAEEEGYGQHDEEDEERRLHSSAPMLSGSAGDKRVAPPVVRRRPAPPPGAITKTASLGDADTDAQLGDGGQDLSMSMDACATTQSSDGAVSVPTGGAVAAIRAHDRRTFRRSLSLGGPQDIPGVSKPTTPQLGMRRRIGDNNQAPEPQVIVRPARPARGLAPGSPSASSTSTAPSPSPRSGAASPTVNPDLEGSERSEKLADKFGKVFQELLQTERDYMRDLRIIVELIKRPLEQKQLIDAQQSLVLFSNVELLIGVNEELLRQLEAVAQTQSGTKVYAPVHTTEKVILRVRFEKELVHKTILVTASTTTAEAIDLLIKKAARTGPDQEKFRSWVLVLADSGKVLEEDAPLLSAAGYQPTQEAPNLVFKPPTNIQARSIGEAFLQLASYLKMYSDYCSNHFASTQLFKELQRENEEIAAFAKALYRNKRCRQLDVPSFLIMPLQRVCKYPLLLKELLNCTPKLHPDYASLSKASELIGAAVMTINNKKKETEANNYMLELHNSIDAKHGFTILAPSRRFVQEGEISLIVKRKAQPAYYFMFNDLLVVTTPAEDERYKLLVSVSLCKALVNIESSVPHAVSVVKVEKSSSTRVMLAGKTDAERDALAAKLQEQVLQDMYNEWSLSPQGKANQGLSFEQWKSTYGHIMT